MIKKLIILKEYQTHSCVKTKTKAKFKHPIKIYQIYKVKKKHFNHKMYSQKDNIKRIVIKLRKQKRAKIKFKL